MPDVTRPGFEEPSLRLVSVTVLGTALVAAGMLAPGTGEATARGHDEVLVKPDVARPGQRVEISTPRCVRGKRQVTSEGFSGPAQRGAATVRREAEPGRYTVVATCGGNAVKGRFTVAGRLSWPTLLPSHG